MLNADPARTLAPARYAAVVLAVAFVGGGCDQEPQRPGQLDDAQDESEGTGGEFNGSTSSADASGDEETGDEETGDERSVDTELDIAPMGDDAVPIVAGPNTTTDTDVNPQWPQVVQLSTGGGRCSGTLISPTHVLTAGHCLSTTATTIRLDTPAAGTAPAGAQYGVVNVQTLSSAATSGQDLQVLLLDEAVPAFGDAGSPLYSAPLLLGLGNVANFLPVDAVGYGPDNDCLQTGLGTRRGLRYLGGFREYGAVPGVITRQNVPCSSALKGPSPGDSGGPLLRNGFVVGVFSGWSCRDITGNILTQPSCSSAAPNSQGTIEWTSVRGSNRTWIEAAMAQDFDGDGLLDANDPLPGVNCTGSSPPAVCNDVKPDFDVLDIRASGCTGIGGSPTIAVTVVNDGPAAEHTWVDLFLGLPAAPTPGTWSAIYQGSSILQERETQVLTFTVSPATNSLWVDAIVDTTQSHDELSESNNVGSAFLTLPDCSFG